MPPLVPNELLALPAMPTTVWEFGLKALQESPMASNYEVTYMIQAIKNMLGTRALFVDGEIIG